MTAYVMVVCDFCGAAAVERHAAGPVLMPEGWVNRDGSDADLCDGCSDL